MTKNQRENNWKSGFHISSDRFKCTLPELSGEHLYNIIEKYKKTHDVSALQKELLKRL